MANSRAPDVGGQVFGGSLPSVWCPRFQPSDRANDSISLGRLINRRWLAL